MKKHTIHLILLILSLNISYSQTPPQRDGSGVATFSDDGIWHKNMELICPVNFPTRMKTEINNTINIGSKYCLVVPLGRDWYSGYDVDNWHIRIDDLTNPRVPVTNIAKIYLNIKENVGTETSPIYQYLIRFFKQVELWDNGKTGSENRVYAVCAVDDRIKSNYGHGPKIKAIILNLTEALDWLDAEGEDEIEIRNLEDRRETRIKGDPTKTNRDVYVGYILENEDYFKSNLSTGKLLNVHTLSIDRISSVLTFSHLGTSQYYDGSGTFTDAFVDVYKLDGEVDGFNDSPPFYGIEDHPNYSYPNDNDPVLPIELSAFEQDGTPIRFTRKNESITWPEEGAPHETHVHKKKAVDMNGNPIMDMMNPSNNYVPNTISMNIASTWGPGLTTVDIDYSDPFDCQVDYVKQIPFNKDFEKFNKELKQIYDRQLINIEFEDYKNKVINELIYIEYLKEISKIDYKKNKNIQNIGETYEYSYQVEQEYENYSKKHYEGYIKFRDRYFDITK